MQKQSNRVLAPISNYYGTPQVLQRDGRFYFDLENYCGSAEVEVTREFYDAFTKEFGRSLDRSYTLMPAGPVTKSIDHGTLAHDNRQLVAAFEAQAEPLQAYIGYFDGFGSAAGTVVALDVAEEGALRVTLRMKNGEALEDAKDFEFAMPVLTCAYGEFGFTAKRIVAIVLTNQPGLEVQQ